MHQHLTPNENSPDNHHQESSTYFNYERDNFESALNAATLLRRIGSQDLVDLIAGNGNCPSI